MRNFAIVCALAVTHVLLAHGQTVARRCAQWTALVCDMSQTVLYMGDPLLEEE